MKSLTLLFVLCALTRTVAAANEELEKALHGSYGGKALHLRHFFKSDSQEYDPQGTPLTRGDEGAWTLYGGMVVKKIRVGDDALLVEGTRAAYVYDKGEKRLMPIAGREKLRIKIRLNTSLTKADEAVTILGRVFALTRDDILNSVPLPWQAYLKKELPSPLALRDAENQPPKNTGDAERRKVFKLGEPGMTPPRILFNRDPEFTDAARKNRFQGVVGLNAVVESTGEIDKISIAHPLGMGLDENAIEGVKSWRFQPATKDGVPVAVSVYIEVDFHFYDSR